MVSAFTQPDVNTWEVGRTLNKLETTLLHIVVSYAYLVNTESILHFFYKITNEKGTKTVFTYARVKWFYGYVNTESILRFFYKITNERGTKTVFTYAHVKWFYGQSERAYYLIYFIKYNNSLYNLQDLIPIQFYLMTKEREGQLNKPRNPLISNIF